VAKRHRTTPLLRLLGRLGWQRDPDLWTVHCREGYGRRARILVHLNAAGVCLTVPEHGPLQLSAWQVGQLRAALRDAFLSLARLAGPDGLADSRRAMPTAPPPARPPSRRQRVPVLIPARPSVSEIAARLTGPSCSVGSEPLDPGVFPERVPLGNVRAARLGRHRRFTPTMT